MGTFYRAFKVQIMNLCKVSRAKAVKLEGYQYRSLAPSVRRQSKDLWKGKIKSVGVVQLERAVVAFPPNHSLKLTGRARVQNSWQN